MSTLQTTSIKHNASTSNNIVLDSGGRVGIGTALPTSLLTVAGNVAISGALISESSSYSTISVLTDSATITPDFSVRNNFSVTLGGNRTLANPTNINPGQSGVIFITQDATGGRTLAFGSSWDFPNGAAPVLTTTANAVDVLVYTVRNSTSIAAQLLNNIG